MPPCQAARNNASIPSSAIMPMGCPGNAECRNRRFEGCLDAIGLTPFAELMFVQGAGGGSRCQTNTTTRPLCEEMAGGLYVCSGVKNPCGDCTAVLKSLQIGVGGEPGSGHKVVAEIIDQQGGSLKGWYDKLIDPTKKVADIYKMVVRFGWCTVGTGLEGCQGAGGVGNAVYKTSGTIYLLPRDMKITFENGRLKFEVEGTDSMEFNNQARQNKVYGQDKPGGKISLRGAIQEFCTDLGWDQPEFKMFTPNGDCIDMIFKWGASQTDQGPNGPEATYPANMLAPLGSIQEWLRLARTVNDKGIFITSDATNPRPKLIFWEDVNSRCDQGDRCKPERVIRHYLVGSGNDTPVLSFSPSIAYNLMAAGSLAQTMQGTQAPAPVQPCPTANPGEIFTIGITGPSLDLFGAIEHAAAIAASVEAHSKANRYQFPISAELRVQGDPSFDSQLCYIGKYISLVVLGGYFPDGTCNGRTPGWAAINPLLGGLTSSPCIDFLSAPDWLIEGVDHTLREGSFQTTFKLRLLRQGTAPPAAS